jgi:hypothetical protein
MTAPYSTWSAIGAEYAYWYLRGTNGYAYGTSGQAMANGADSGAGRMKGIVSLTPEVPAPNNIGVVGDLRNIATFRTASQDPTTGSMEVAVFDTTFINKANNTISETLGDYKFVDVDPYCVNNQAFGLIVNAPAVIQDSGASLGASAYEVTMIYNTLIDAPALAPLADGGQTWQYNLTLNPTGTTPYGVALTSVANGLTRAYFRKFASPAPVTMHTFIGDGTDTTLVLDLTPFANSANAVRVWVAGTPLTFSSDFTVDLATRTITFAVAPTAGAIVEVLYQHVVTC